MRNYEQFSFLQALLNCCGNGVSCLRQQNQTACTHVTRSATKAVVVAAILLWTAPNLCAAPGKVHNTHQASKPAKASAKKNVANGRRLFMKDGCYECHGTEAQGSPTTGPRLGPDPIPLSAIIAYVRAPTGQMPPYTAKVISDRELADIYAFLKSLPQPPPLKTIPILNH